MKIPDVSIVEASAELLYGLVHQRYILTRAGLHAMVSVYRLVFVVLIILRRQRSTRLGNLALVPAFIASLVMSYPVAGQTYLASTL